MTFQSWCPVAALPARGLVSATTSASGEPVTILSASESWDLLASVALGRLVTSVEGHPRFFR